MFSRRLNFLLNLYYTNLNKRVCNVYTFCKTIGSSNSINALHLPISYKNLQPIINIGFQKRYYAKGKDKKKDKGKAKVGINENQLAEVINIDFLKKQLQSSVENLRSEFEKHLSLRSSAGAIESILVDVDGQEHTLQEVAQIVRKNPKTIVVNMGVFPQAIPAAVKAIQNSGMNLNPQQEGNTLYIPVPKVTKEHRENLSKNAKAIFIKSRDNIKDILNKQIKSLKKKDSMSIDTVHSTEQQILAIGDVYLKEAERILDSKQKELLG